MHFKVAVALIIFSIPFGLLHSQVIDSSDISVYKQNIFLKLFFPKGIAEGVALRSYLRSDSWDEFRNSHSDREDLDEIFEDADDLCHSNKTAAILAASIA